MKKIIKNFRGFMTGLFMAIGIGMRGDVILSGYCGIYFEGKEFSLM